MDEQRFQELLSKRDETGLNDDEADELGRMFAEREGAVYSNAETAGAAREGEEPAETRTGDDAGRGPVKDEVRDEEVKEDRTSTNPA